ncbi:hypothetical protein HXA31_18815 [Salipaludibacillus agaradhaerens]|uniref:Uncharacterized protein n=1 Tax=Salipaludibacillus agaradhaerens TaxID=76935 RepID=A0A9Q4B435_SALAG|nr:RAxF-45 family protein [Salipaludibacillus agaradhaerens]MCR6097978.1 hypothetical protein [Salipaludibacillus agaradhaerens]MCR6116393.1 hypothetical protein [Salipaludibacillus agaradhaerens]
MNQAVFNIARQRYVTFLYIVRAVFYAVAFKGGSLPFFSNFIKYNKNSKSISIPSYNKNEQRGRAYLKLSFSIGKI